MKKNNYVIAIPTYKRPGTIREKTLSTLENEGFPKDRIYIFFASMDEKVAYDLGPDYPNQIIGRLGLTHQRNFIVEYFAEGQHIIWLDDDISEIKGVEKDPEKKGKDFDNRYKDATVAQVAELGFNELHKHGSSLFGVYPVNNKGFMTIDGVTTDLKYIIGCCYGTINRKRLFPFVVDEGNGGAKEDFLRTLMLYTAEGVTVRLNCFTPITNYYKEEGGLQSLETEFGARKERDKISMDYICTHYQGMAFPKITKEGYPEIKLRDTIVNKQQTTLF